MNARLVGTPSPAAIVRSHRFRGIRRGLLSFAAGALALGTTCSLAQAVSDASSTPMQLAQAQTLDKLFETTTPEVPSTEGATSGGSEPQPTKTDSLFESTGESQAEPQDKKAGEAAEQPKSVDSLDSLFSTEESAAKSKATDTSWLTGFIQNEFAYTYPSPDHFSKLRTTLELVADGSFDNGINWRLGGRLAYDPIYDMTNFYPESVRDDESFEAQIREAYIDVPRGDFELRLGRQHIIWGEVIGGFVADVVSAKDLRENVVQDFDLLRIPQWAARVEYFRGDLVAGLVWIPLMTVNDVGKLGGDFFPAAPPLPGFTPFYRGDDAPPPALSNSAFGARLSYFKGGADMSLFYFSSLDQQAAYRRELEPSKSTVIYTPIHQRIHQVGATLTKDIGGALFKFEGVYTIDRQYSLTGLADPDGLTRQNVLNYLLSLEWAFENETNLNVQFFQQWFPDHESTMVPDELETFFSVYLSTKAFHSDVKPELLWIQGLNRSDWLLEAKVNWQFRPSWKMVVGADIFGGRPDGQFGQFDESDRLYYELRYSF